MTTPKALTEMAKNLPHGAKCDIADKLGCDPSKVSKALRGYVKQESFMVKLEREIRAMLPTVEAATA